MAEAQGPNGGSPPNLPLRSVVLMRTSVLDLQNEDLQSEDLQDKPEFIDCSAPLFSMYNKITKEHDKNVAESWKGGADAILIFVRQNKPFFPRLDINPLKCILDWLVLGSHCTTPCKLASEPPAKPSKCFVLLSCPHISAHPRFGCVVHSPP
jgi:hypothetical protein